MIERYSGVLFGQGENAEGLVVREKDSPEAARAALLRGRTDLPDGTRLVVWKQRKSQFDRDCAIAIEEESEGFSRSSYRRRVEYAQEMIRRTGGRPPQNNRPPTLAIAASRRIREKLDELAAAGSIGSLSARSSPDSRTSSARTPRRYAGARRWWASRRSSGGSLASGGWSRGGGTGGRE